MPLYKIKKRTGAIVDFNIDKIERAIEAALKASDSEADKAVAYAIAQDVMKTAEEVFQDRIPSVEEVQDIAEQMLIKYDYAAAAKAYILYRAKRSEAREDKNVMVEVNKTISEYLDRSDWRVSANSNQGYSLGGMILNTSGKVTANYWLSHIYPQAIGDAHRNGDYHIHDLDMFSGYCAGWSLRALLEEGFNGVQNKIESDAPKHLCSAVAQMVNFLGTLQNEWAGAQAFSSFDTYLAPFVKKYELEIRDEIDKAHMHFPADAEKETYIEKRVYDYVFQNMQSFVFNLNIPSRWGTQTPFTNITLDWECPEDLKDKRLRLGGELFPFSYDQLQNEMDIINKAFINVMIKGDRKGRTFTFPIPTYNITKDFKWEDPKTLPLFDMTAKYGTPYFQNFINSDINPGDVRSMCCRLQLDLKELKKRGGGLFGSAEMTGSIGVVTLNLARIGFMNKGNKDLFLKRVEHLMELAKTSLELKRKEIELWMDRGLFPFTKRYLGKLTNHFSTIGINGMNEAIRNFTSDKENITTDEGQKFAHEVMDFIRHKMKQYQEETGNLYNLEATPAEGTTYRLAKEDKKRFPEILQAGTQEAPYYTNSSQLPTGLTDDVFYALELQDDLQKKYTGGTVFHCYMSEKISSPEACRDLVRKILSRFKLPYITITPTFSICPKHGYLEGEHDYCPTCDKDLGIENQDGFDTTLRKAYISAAADK
ncbi:MAG: ribonucleoside triphosphate reductase [Candidatus Magasanikbacteria bacterium]|jgi:ribonucleoside-triphosphate reductase (formate)|nr:ribonucleoside triphosphate reductase [Candidatus Magasanikbacteria bacterium]